MNFAEAINNEVKKTYTENGATAFNTSDDALVDLYSTIGALREAEDVRILRLFDEAYKMNPLMTTKILYYSRDIREGLGERKTFRTIIKHMATYMPEALRPNLDLIGVYGRYDDLYSLIDTPLENDMWKVMKEQLDEDIKNMEQGNVVSLLAKWIKTADASSLNTRKLGIKTALKLGYTNIKEYKRIIRKLRKHIGVVEVLMSQNRWGEIKYSEVPSRAMMIYHGAFLRHDMERFTEFNNKAVTGEEKINSAALYPYDLIDKYVTYWLDISNKEDITVEAQWRQLPNYVANNSSAIVMADTSGSMHGRPLATALGLAIYFAERNTGAYKDLFMTFSSRPKYQKIKGLTLLEKLHSINMDDWQMNTDLEAAFLTVLGTAVDNKISQDEMPKAIIVISDMEIDDCANKDWGFYDDMRRRYAENGYEIPTVIFWNVNSRHDVFHADANRKGVQLVSGASTAVFKQLMDNIGLNAREAMERVINSERYNAITVEKRSMV